MGFVDASLSLEFLKANNLFRMESAIDLGSAQVAGLRAIRVRLRSESKLVREFGEKTGAR